jgi:hypothetical protein
VPEPGDPVHRRPLPPLGIRVQDPSAAGTFIIHLG